VAQPDILRTLIGNTDPAQFLSRDWGHTMRHWPGALTQHPELLLSLETFEKALAKFHRAHEGWLHFADQGLRAIPQDFVRSDGMLDMRRIAEAFSEGQTLYLTKAERTVSGLGALCRGLSADLEGYGVALREAINAHVFLTPSASQGFSPHCDAHASFILQCEGEKRWKIYTPRVTTPRECRPGATSAELLAKHDVSDVTLSAGDVLYMPEWWPHEAIAADQHSLHVTIRLFPLRWTDLVQALAGGIDTLAASVPIGTDAAVAANTLYEQLCATDTKLAIADMLPPLWPGISTPPVPEQMTNALRETVAAARLELTTPLMRAQYLSCEVELIEDSAVLSFGGITVRGPRLFSPVFEFVAGHTRLRPCDLPEIEAEYDRLDVIRRLMRDGLLTAEATR